MEDAVLLNHLLQNVSDARWEDQKRNLLLLQMVEKHFVTVSMETTQHNQSGPKKPSDLPGLNLDFCTFLFS